MRFLIFGTLCVALTGCTVDIPNGVFGCVDDSECPTGFSCWADFRCYDAPDPGCQPLSCEQIIDVFGFAGVMVECGDLPDGCGETQPCDTCEEGETCGGTSGANPFLCCAEGDCELDPCVEAAAQCGSVSTAFCGECEDNGFEGYRCVENQCVCEDEYEENDTAQMSVDVCEKIDCKSSEDNAFIVIPLTHQPIENGLAVTFDGPQDADWFTGLTNLQAVAVTAREFDEDLVDLFIGFSCQNSGSPSVFCPDGEAPQTVEGIRGCKLTSDTAAGVCGGPIVGSKVRVFVRPFPRDWEPECQPYEGLVVISRPRDSELEQLMNEAGDG